MKFKLIAGIAAATLALAAPGISAAQDAHATPILELARDGLHLKDAESGKSDTIGFGTGQDDTVQFVGTALGEPTGTVMDDSCDGTLNMVDFQGDLRLYFKAGEFAGWEIGHDSGFASEQGIRIGMTTDQLRAATHDLRGEESGLGYEWHAGGFSGLFTDGLPAGKITDIWAGQTCIMR